MVLFTWSQKSDMHMPKSELPYAKNNLALVILKEASDRKELKKTDTSKMNEGSEETDTSTTSIKTNLAEDSGKKNKGN